LKVQQLIILIEKIYTDLIYSKMINMIGIILAAIKKRKILYKNNNNRKITNKCMVCERKNIIGKIKNKYIDE